jgi:hypothetical protein
MPVPDDRNALLRHGAAELAQPGHLDPEHLAIEKEQRAQRLAMRGRRDTTLVGEHDQEALHLRRAEIARMAQPRPADEAAHPIDIGLLGP